MMFKKDSKQSASTCIIKRTENIGYRTAFAAIAAEKNKTKDIKLAKDAERKAPSTT